MTNLLEKFEKNQIDKLTSKKRIPTFRPGDTIKVTLKIIEGEKSRLQAFEGVCIARKNNAVNSKFTVRKLSHGEGVERVFPLFSPIIDKIEVIRKGDVKRAKLYYLRSRTGKRARISDKDRGDEADQYELSDTQLESSSTKDQQFNENSEEISENAEAKDEPKEVSEKAEAKEEPKVKEKSEISAPEAEITENESKS